jgi:membrane protease YdiL (CAAX protease family)
MNVYQLIGDPISRLRESDRLGIDQPSKPYPPIHRWRFNAGLRLLVFVGAMGAVMVSVGAVVGLVAGFIIGRRARDSGGDVMGVVQELVGRLSGSTMLGMGLELVAAIGAYVVLVSAMERRGWPVELAWRRAGGLGQGLVLGFVLVSLPVGLVALAGGYHILGVNPDYSPWVDLFTLGLGAAVAEELMFRGVVFRLLEDTFGTVIALVASSLIFGAIHYTNPDGTVQGAVGIAIAASTLPAIYIATRSLWCCIGYHFAWNVAQGPLWGSIVSGTGQQDSWLRVEWSGPEWLTGGQFGIEGSVPLIVLEGAVAVWILVKSWRAGCFVAPSWRRRAAARAAMTKLGPCAPGPSLPSPDCRPHLDDCDCLTPPPGASSPSDRSGDRPGSTSAASPLTTPPTWDTPSPT